MLMGEDSLLSEFLSLVQIEDFDEIYSKDISRGQYFGMPLSGIIESEKRLRSKDERGIAYFSMEYGLGSSFYNRFTSNRDIDEKNKYQEHEVFSNYRLADYFFTLKMDGVIDLPIYSGGLGVLAGDTLKTMADYRLPAVGVGMLWNAGYFRQRFWFKYGQTPEEMHWDMRSYPGLIPLKEIVKVSLKSEDIYLRLWKYYIYSYRRDYAIPLILLDANVPQNKEESRHLTDQLYKSDSVRVKIMQRVILGMGGVAALDALGYNVYIYHLNEGHSVFAFLEKSRGLTREGIEDLKRRFAYTCHTPVDAGHDRFQFEELEKVLKKEDLKVAEEFGKEEKGTINLTLLSMNVSSSINAVSKGHQRVMHMQFPKYREQIKYITNGVHTHTWISERFMSVFERFASVLGDVRANPMALAKVKDLKANDEFRNLIWQAHQGNKSDLCAFLDKWRIDKDVFTICWARRVAAYKRPSLILQDVNRLIDIARRCGPIQIIFAGKAHPKDDLGFTYINKMLDTVDELTQVYDIFKVIMLENYEIALAKMLVSSVDVWLNNPLPPFEASGTSGMKAILNGVVQLSTLDGWVREAEEKNIGRIFGYKNPEDKIGSEYDLHISEDSRQLYSALEEIVQLYYKTNNNGEADISSFWIDTMIDCIASGAYFNTYRMLDEYKRIWGIP